MGHNALLDCEWWDASRGLNANLNGKTAIKDLALSALAYSQIAETNAVLEAELA